MQMSARVAAPLALALLASAAAAQTVVVPNALATLEGNAQNAFPFGITVGHPATQRYQQVYAASQFAGIAASQQITEIRFRPNAGATFDPWSNTMNVEVRLSTTAAAPDALSATFAENIGAGETLVYAGPLTISTAQTGPALPGPMDFDMVIVLQTPFAYDAAAGNLLLDIVRDGFTPQTNKFLDSHGESGDGVSRVHAPSATAVTGSADTVGLPTQFVFESGGACYANCDASTAPPILNVADFTCFLQRFAAGDPYANCDESSAPPVLNVADFTCFLQRFAAGCP